MSYLPRIMWHKKQTFEFGSLHCVCDIFCFFYSTSLYASGYGSIIWANKIIIFNYSCFNTQVIQKPVKYHKMSIKNKNIKF